MATSITAHSLKQQLGVPSVTLAHDASGTNTVLVVLTACFDANINNRTVAGVKYNGVSLTEIPGAKKDNAANFINQIFYLINPTSGTNNVVASIGGAAAGSNIFAVTITGARQSSQPDASNAASGNAVTSIATTLTTVASNALILSVGQATNGPMGIGGGQTGLDPAVGSDHQDAFLQATTATGYPLSYTTSVGDDLTISAASFAPAVAAVVGTNLLTLLGVG